MKNQHQSGQSPWKLKLSHRQMRAGARLFWASNHCAQRRMHPLLLLSGEAAAWKASITESCSQLIMSPPAQNRTVPGRASVAPG